MASPQKRFGQFLRAFSLCFGLIALFAVGSLLSPEFLTIDNQRDVLWQVSSNGIIAVGMTLVILTGGIDLSVGSLLSVGSVICAMLLMQRGWTNASYLGVCSVAIVAGWLIATAVRRVFFARRKGGRAVSWGAGLAGAALAFWWGASQVPNGFGVVAVLIVVPAVGLLLGAMSGVLIARGSLQPFIVTLAMMVSAVGLARHIAGMGGQIHPIFFGDPTTGAVAPSSFTLLASNIRIFGRELIPVPGIFFAVCALLAWVLLSRTSAGRYIYAVGGNEEAGRYSGIDTGRVKVLVYALSGMVSALAAVLYGAMYQQGKADAGSGRELDAIAAVVIGGTSLMGGRGGIGGTIVGVFIFGYLKNILNLRGVPTEFQNILQGIIIVAAVLLQEGVLARWIADAAKRLKGRPA